MITFLSFIRREDGATAIEYSLIAAMVAVVAIAGFSAFSVAMSDMYTNGILNKFNGTP